MNVQQRQQTAVAVDRANHDWYKDAVIYQLHVKAYQDGSGDGIGDFAGLMERLDHIQELGATAIWLLPFYPSPLRDDGYDISKYRETNPAYGRLTDFRAFVKEAHRRGLRVITELVINHTSDQHPWFQRARRAKRGSAARNFYVWSDDPGKFPETRIIFTDTESSNWSWDPVAGQYYWHRFYHHQPDLNFDNPRVLREILKVMNFWLDIGVDGLRLDAIPYLVEREGTNNENLPETHAVLREIRAALDARYPDRMLLAEANQWPEDTRPYFGEGDECHMGFHFPLMPRMYMALAQEDRHPITDIIRQTPEIPDECQWGIFLRNHDELTLEMVTDRERDYLWEHYAADGRARINLGIRRRLAPLLQNDRRKIELMTSLLLSMRGTPILYYGDEIGMGDNYYLGDRDGVRTPMQWSPDRNGGFSRANPQQLYLPAIQDPLYGYQAVNVEAQQGDPSSLLNWMKRMIAVRQRHSVFGRGEVRILYPSNRKVLAYIREDATETVLCIANLSRSAQAAELDLADYAGRVPIEMTGSSPFPAVGELAYLVTLPAYGFYWFLLAPEEDWSSWHTPGPQALPEFLTLTTRDGRLATALAGREGRQLAAETLPKFLPMQRWFAAKDRAIREVALRSLAESPDGRHVLAELTVRTEAESQRYFMPLTALWGEEHLGHGAASLSYTIARLRRGPTMGALVDGTADAGLAADLLAGLRAGRRLATADGEIVFEGGAGLAEVGEAGPARLLSFEQSNASISMGDRVILKIYRRLREGIQPDIEVARFLTEAAGFAHTPAFLGAIEHRPSEGEPTALGAAFAYVANQGDAWSSVTDALGRDLEDFALTGPEGHDVAQPVARELQVGALLGTRTAELHRALAIDTADPAFAAEPMTADDVTALVAGAEGELAAMLDDLAGRAATLPEDARAAAAGVLEAREALASRLAALRATAPSGVKTRTHGDYHLGQVLVVQNDVTIIDFEGEPGRPLAARRAKASPLQDVAGMLRSLDYAAWTASRHCLDVGANPERTEMRAAYWRRWATDQFMDAYRDAIADCPAWPPDAAFAARLLDLFLIRKAVYEVGYELSSRPQWVAIPLQGLLSLLEAGGEP